MTIIEKKSDDRIGLFTALLIGGLMLLIVGVDAMLLSRFWQGKPEALDPAAWIGLGVVQVVAVAMFSPKVGAFLGSALRSLGRTVKFIFQLTLWGIIAYVGYLLLSSPLNVAILLGAGIIAYAIFATRKPS